MQDDAQLREAPPERIRASGRAAGGARRRPRALHRLLGRARARAAQRGRAGLRRDRPGRLLGRGLGEARHGGARDAARGHEADDRRLVLGAALGGPAALARARPGPLAPRPRGLRTTSPRALATRYSGRYVDPAAGGDPLPAVRLWTTWNEPNHPAFLMPQWERRGGRWLPASPHWYRRMHEAADAAIVAADPRNRVLIGGLSSVGHDTRGEAARMTPLRFVRELACVDVRLRPLRRPECRDYRPLRADGFSIHPYGFSLPPDGEPELPGQPDHGSAAPARCAARGAGAPRAARAAAAAVRDRARLGERPARPLPRRGARRCRRAT